MIVERKNLIKKKVGNLQCGDCFSDQDIIYMVTEIDEDDAGVTCIGLSGDRDGDGIANTFKSEKLVVPIVFKLVQI
jgi:hypothetical protein